jgi:anti-anti-sigma factor
MEHSTHDNTLVLSGALDVRCTAELRATLYGLLGQTSGEVRVDIARVDSIDMTTLKMLAVANRFAEREGRRVLLCGVSTATRRLLHLSHLRWMIPVEPQAHFTAS